MKLGGRVLGCYGHTIGPRPIKPYMGWIRMMRRTVWCPFAPLGPSGGNYYFTPNFWVGRGSETVGRRGPGSSLKVSPIVRCTCCAQSSKLILQKKLTWTPLMSKLVVDWSLKRWLQKSNYSMWVVNKGLMNIEERYWWHVMWNMHDVIEKNA